MIQKFNLNIKSFFNKNIINFQNTLTLNEFQLLETFLLNHLSSSNFHSHYNEICKSPNMKYLLSYERNYITFQNNCIMEETCLIPVVYCNNCNHCHALLPNLFIAPYCQYSISFILCVLYDKECSNLTVENILEKYRISKSTLYRWIEKFKLYLTYFLQLRSKHSNHIFICFLDRFDETLQDLFDICANTLFQTKCILYKPSPS